METMLKAGYRKIMELFYNEKSAQIHLRNIARKTKLNENSATRFLKELEKNQVLKSKKDGNLKKYSIQKNLNTFILFVNYDIEKYNKLPSIRRNAIQYFLKKLNEQPVMVILFGSTAKANFTKKSDIDLLLVLNKKIKIKNAENYAEAQTGVNINCLQINYEDFLKEVKLKEDSVIQSAIKSGFPLTNHIKYYGEIL